MTIGEILALAVVVLAILVVGMGDWNEERKPLVDLALVAAGPCWLRACQLPWRK